MCAIALAGEVRAPVPPAAVGILNSHDGWLHVRQSTEGARIKASLQRGNN